MTGNTSASNMRDDSEPDEEYPDALDLLSHGTRVAILRELARASGPLQFAELRRRVGTRDSGTFNYHLSKLVGRFVEDDDLGYRLAEAGSHLIAAAGVAQETAMGDTQLIDGECPVCGEPDCGRLYHIHLDAR